MSDCLRDFSPRTKHSKVRCWYVNCFEATWKMNEQSHCLSNSRVLFYTLYLRCFRLLHMANCIRCASRQDSRNSNTSHALFLHVNDSLFYLQILHVHSPLQDNDLAHRYLSPSANVSALQMPHRQISNLLVLFFVATCIYKEQMVRKLNLFAFYSEHSVHY